MRRKISLGWIRFRRMPSNSIKRIDHRSPTSLQQPLVKTGSRLVKHARYYWLLLAESHLRRRPFGSTWGGLRRSRCQRGGRSLGVKHFRLKGRKRWNGV
jgi:hypothetical protein